MTSLRHPPESPIPAGPAQYLSSGANCGSGSHYTLATDTLIMTVDTPTVLVPPDGYTVPLLTPSGTYRLCAKIDHTNEHAETSEDDNIVRSELEFEVL